MNLDKIGHQVLNTNMNVLHKIEDTFGSEVFRGARPDDPELEKENYRTGKRIIDRRSLGKLVFSDSEKIHRLNQIMWPTIAELQNMGK